MMRAYVLVYALTLVVGCGGGNKKPAKPKPKGDTADKGPEAETEADREKKRRMIGYQIVPEGSNCLPVALKEDSAPRLEIAGVGKDAVVCAIDDDRQRLLGPIGCWKVNLTNGELAYQAPEVLPGRGITVTLDDRCARGYCLPKDAKLGDGKVAFLAKSVDGTQVAVLAGEDVHIFKADSKEHVKTFSIRGEKGVSNEPKAVHFVDNTILVEGIDQGPYSAVWVFKADGTPVGPVTSLGGKEEKPISTFHGSFSILDKSRIAIAEKGMETLTTYEVETGKRAKLVRKVGKTSCKPAELDAFWVDGDKVTDKCKESINKVSGHLMGATVVAGAKSLLVMLRGDRLGELAIMDNKTLAEKSVIKMPWCGGKGDGGKDKDKVEKKDGDKKEKEEAPKQKAPSPAKAQAPAKRGKGGDKDKDMDSSDPQEGGQ